jgi:methyl-accepting chemotaxis protein
MLNRLPIGIKVFIVPGILIVLMLCVILISELAVKRQQDAFLQVVGGPLTTSTATTRLLLAVGEVQSDMLRYAQLRQRLSADDKILIDLRRSIISKYQFVDSLFEKVRSTSGAGERDAISNISDFLTIHRAVSLKIVDGAPISSMTISTLMAHYQQLQSYIVELATRSLESAQAIENETAKGIENFSYYLLAASAVIIVVSILLAYYFGRAISRPITHMISVMSSIAAGNFAVFRVRHAASG